MKAVLFIAIFCLAVSATSVTSWTEEDETVLSYRFACVRGFFQGWSRGFYNRPSYHIPDSCFGTGARKLS